MQIVKNVIFSVMYHHLCVLQFFFFFSRYNNLPHKYQIIPTIAILGQIQNCAGVIWKMSQFVSVPSRLLQVQGFSRDSLCVLQTWEGCRVSISSVATTWGSFDEGTPRSSTHRMKLINFMSYLNGFTVRVDSQSVCAAGRRVIGRERPTVCVWEREDRITVRTELLLLTWL